MRKILKALTLFALIFGGIVLTAGSCETCNVYGAFAGVAMIAGGAALANSWEKEIVG